LALFYSIEGVDRGEPGGNGSQPPMSELDASAIIVQFLGRQVRRTGKLPAGPPMRWRTRCTD